MRDLNIARKYFLQNLEFSWIRIFKTGNANKHNLKNRPGALVQLEENKTVGRSSWVQQPGDFGTAGEGGGHSSKYYLIGASTEVISAPSQNMGCGRS
jgi:hypothetical protein